MKEIPESDWLDIRPLYPGCAIIIISVPLFLYGLGALLYSIFS